MFYISNKFKRTVMIYKMMVLKPNRWWLNSFYLNVEPVVVVGFRFRNQIEMTNG